MNSYLLYSTCFSLFIFFSSFEVQLPMSMHLFDYHQTYFYLYNSIVVLSYHSSDMCFFSVHLLLPPLSSRS